MTKWLVLVLKGDSMVRHHMGPNRRHPDRSSCMGLSANGWMSQDQVFCTFSEQMLRIVYSAKHSPGFVSASATPWECTGWYKPKGIYCALHTPKHLLRECTEHLVLAHSAIHRQAQALPGRQELLSGCIRLGPMRCRSILSPFRTRARKFVISIWINQVNTLLVLVTVHSVHCKLYCVLQCSTLHY